MRAKDSSDKLLEICHKAESSACLGINLNLNNDVLRSRMNAQPSALTKKLDSLTASAPLLDDGFGSATV